MRRSRAGGARGEPARGLRAAAEAAAVAATAAIAAVKFAPVLEFVEKVEAAHAAADGSLKPRDVLVFHGSRNGDFDAETLHALSVVTECCILDLPEGVTVETVDEDEMRNLGWVRA